MKRLFTYGLMLASAFALTNCTEQLATPEMEEKIVDEIVENNPPQEEGDRIPFEVYVNTVETKTITQDNKTFWVDEYTAKTYGLTQDAIYLYSYPASEADASKQKFTNHLEFRYNANGRFLGSVVEDALSSANNWYCIYPYNEVSMSTGSTIKETLTIGAKKSDGYIQVQTGLANMNHIAGGNYPMYGILNNVAKTKSPKFSMNHLFALVELEIQNLGDKIANQKETEVVIENIEFTAPEAIVGDFDVTISGSQPTYKPTSDVSSKAIVNFTGSTVSIPTGNSAKVYFAVKPFDASGKSITLKINGAEKTITMPGNAKFEAGKKTTLKVPIEFGLGTPITNIRTQKGTQVGVQYKVFKKETQVDMLTFTNFSEADMEINGEVVRVYTIGKFDEDKNEYTPGSITLRGKPTEFLKLMPLQFYAAAGPNGKSVMRLGSIKANVFGTVLEIGMLKEVVMSYDKLVNTVGLDPKNIVFDGLLPIQLQDNKSLILYEDPIHKQVSEEQAANLILRFDDDDYDDKVPTYAALFELFTAKWDEWSGYESLSIDARTTAEILFNKLYPIVKAYVGDQFGKLFDVLFSSPKAFINIMKNDASMEVVLETVPIDEEAGINDTRVLVWGLNSAKISN